MAKKLQIKSMAVSAAATGAGAVAGAAMDKIGIIGSQSGLIRGGIKIVAGVLVPHFLGKGKSAGLMQSIGAGMIAVGALNIANATIFKGNPLVAGVPTLGYTHAYVAPNYNDGADTGTLSGVPGQTIGEMPNGYNVAYSN